MKDTWEGCTPDGKPPVIGQVYRVKHRRKGEFSGRVVSADATTWADVEITKGRAGAIYDYNVREKGETVAVRSSLCTMEPIR